MGQDATSGILLGLGGVGAIGGVASHVLSARDFAPIKRELPESVADRSGVTSKDSLLNFAAAISAATSGQGRSAVGGGRHSL